MAILVSLLLVLTTYAVTNELVSNISKTFSVILTAIGLLLIMFLG